MHQKTRRIVIWLAISLIFIGIVSIYFYYQFEYRYHTEPKTDAKWTNMDAVLYTTKEQLDILEDFGEMYRTMDSHVLETGIEMIVIPGMESTRSLVSNNSNSISICTSMTPQGLCITEQYILVSAYCHTHSHNSVIYVIDKESRQFIKEIVLEDKNHVGGLAFDTQNHMIWVATSFKGRAAASAFSLHHLETYDLDNTIMPMPYTYEYELYTLETDSFMTYANGYLYIGHFAMNGNSVVQKFKIEEDGALKTESGASIGIEKEIALPVDVKDIPKRIQGLAVYGNKVILTQSYGWTPSKLIVYNYDNVMNNISPRYTLNMIPMPQKMQQIYIDGNSLYVLFESSAYAYRAQPLPKVDRICVLNLADVIQIDEEDLGFEKE